MVIKFMIYASGQFLFVMCASFKLMFHALKYLLIVAGASVILGIFIFLYGIFSPVIILIFICLVIYNVKHKILNRIYKKKDILNSCLTPEFEVFRGLKNSSNFCYMNAMMQALASSDQIIRELKILGDANIPKMNKLISLLQDLNDPRMTAEDSTQELCDLMNMISWEKSAQQDAFDLLSALINSIHKEIRIGLSVAQIQMPLKIKLLHTFNGIDFPNKAQDHLGLSLGLYGEYSRPPGVRLVDLIKEHFTPTFIDNDPNVTTQMVFYKEAPDVLLLHMQANKWDEIRGEMYKPVYHIIYGKDLLLDMDIATDEMNLEIRHETGIKYQLCALVHHIGNIYGGHYITYRKWRGRWHLVSDEQVMEVEFRNDVCPYIMIYEKVK